MNQLQRRALICALFVCVLPRPARAQQQEDPVQTARMRLGPFGVTPAVSLVNLGVDSNVFNSVDNPQRDFTVTVTPEVKTWLRAGPSRLAMEGHLDMVYFQTFASERSLDPRVAGKWEVPLNHVAPWISGAYSQSRERVGYEIDLRSELRQTDSAAGLDLNVAPKTVVGLSVRRTEFRYAADAFFDGSSLQQVLDRTSESAGVAVRFHWTALTTAVVEGDALRDRFEFAALRNTSGIRVQTGFDLDRHALISGSGRIGVRTFNGVGGGVPSFQGVVGNVSAASTVFGRARLEVTGARDVLYSYELGDPYYIQTGVLLTGTPQLTDKWDVQGRTGVQRLAYQGIAPALGRVDTYTKFGAGVGYHLARGVRIGFNLDHERRASPLQSRDYVGYRVGTSVTYEN
jgi:hypothetical protein